MSDEAGLSGAEFDDVAQEFLAGLDSAPSRDLYRPVLDDFAAFVADTPGDWFDAAILRRYFRREKGPGAGDDLGAKIVLPELLQWAGDRGLVTGQPTGPTPRTSVPMPLDVQPVALLIFAAQSEAREQVRAEKLRPFLLITCPAKSGRCLATIGSIYQTKHGALFVSELDYDKPATLDAMRSAVGVELVGRDPALLDLLDLQWGPLKPWRPEQVEVGHDRHRSYALSVTAVSAAVAEAVNSGLQKRIPADQLAAR